MRCKVVKNFVALLHIQKKMKKARLIDPSVKSAVHGE